MKFGRIAISRSARSKRSSYAVKYTKAQEFHTFGAKALFACKRARPDIGTATIAMTACVQKPKEDDWVRLVRMMRYLNGTRNDKLICLPMMSTPVLLCILTLGATLAVL